MRHYLISTQSSWRGISFLEVVRVIYSIMRTRKHCGGEESAFSWLGTSGWGVIELFSREISNVFLCFGRLENSLTFVEMTDINVVTFRTMHVYISIADGGSCWQLNRVVKAKKVPVSDPPFKGSQYGLIDGTRDIGYIMQHTNNKALYQSEPWKRVPHEVSFHSSLLVYHSSNCIWKSIPPGVIGCTS